MKKFIYTLAFTLFTVVAAHAQLYVVVNGTTTNANGTNFPIYISVDDSTSFSTAYTDSSGFFSDSLIISGMQGTVFLWFYDCNGTPQYFSLPYGPANMVLNVTIDFCPNTGNPTPIVINGQLTNTNGTIVTVTFVTDNQPGGVSTTTQTDGSFVVTVLINSFGNPITGSFTDCTGAVQTYPANIVFGTTTATFNADFCDTTGNPVPCGSMFTTTYNVNDNSFTLTMDSSAPSPMLNTYEWNFGDGTTSSDILPTHTYADEGIYNVCLYIASPNGMLCSYCHEIGIDSAGNPVTRMDAAPFTINVVPFGTLGVDELAPTTFDIYPNPVGDNGLVSLYSDKATTYTINVFNAIGQQVKTYNVDATTGLNNVRLPMQDLTEGVYLMNIQFDGKNISRSFVK